jgi:hypothetical protein
MLWITHLGARVVCFGHRVILVFTQPVMDPEHPFGGGLTAATLAAQNGSPDARCAPFVCRLHVPTEASSAVVNFGPGATAAGQLLFPAVGAAVVGEDAARYVSLSHA